ncbi:uncharacterized protein LOC118426440 [Branchiostoma floridae]|uniref:Uncharacterized protein LOC118426440 n=1 Tax=Branchiostoma floridae TaxID=7739 RepID=A0A9J7N3G7_BRAFL|nr:uncharacterized protein LOC118426440 [Branchiostoma floridae]
MMWGNDDQIIIEQQRNGNGIQSTVQGWMNGGLPDGKEKYTKDGKRIVAEEEWFYENGKWAHIWIYEDQVLEVEDARSRLDFEAAARELKKTTQVIEETVVEEKEVEEEIKGPGMRIIIKGPFRLQRAPPKPGIKWKKKVEEVLGEEPMVWKALVAGALKHGTENDLGDCSLAVLEPAVVDALVYGSDSESAIPVVLEQVESGSGDDVDEAMVSAGPKEDFVLPVTEGKGNIYLPTLLEKVRGNGHGGGQELAEVKKELRVIEALEESDSGIENTPTHEIRKLKQIQYGIGYEEKQLGDMKIATAQFQQANVVSQASEKFSRPAVQQVKTEDAVYNQGTEQTLKLELESTRTTVVTPSVSFDRPKYSNVTQQLLQPKTTTAKSQDAEYHRGVAGSVSPPQEEKITGDIESFEYQKVNYEYVDVTKNRAQESITRSLDPNYNNAVEEVIKIPLGELQGVVPGLVYVKPCYEILKQEQNKAFVSQVISESPVFMEAGQGQTKIRPVGNVAEIAPIKWHQATVAKTGETLSTAKSSVVKTEMEYNKGKQEETFVTAEEVKDNIEKLTYSKAAVEETKKLPSVKPEVFQAKIQRGKYLEAEEARKELKLEEAKENIEKFTYTKATIKQTEKQRSLKPEVFQQASQEPQFSQAKETKRELKLKTTLEEIPAFKYQNSPITKITKVPFHMVVKSTVDVCVPLYRGEEGSVTVEPEEVDAELKPLDFKKTTFEPIKQVVWKHNTDEVSSYDAKYLSGEENKITLEEEELGTAIEPYKIESCTFSTVSQEVNKANSEEVKASAPNYLQGTEDEVVVEAEQTRKGEPPIPWEKAAVENIDVVLSSVNSEITETQESAYLEAEEAEEHVTAEEAGTFEGFDIQTPTYEIIEGLEGKVENVALQKTEAPQYNQGIENELEKLELEKARRIQPPIIERAVVDVIEIDKAAHVYVNQQQVVQVPLSIHTAVEGDLPEWEVAEEVEFEELKPMKATPKMALGQLYMAKGQQPKVGFAEEPSPVISDEVHLIQRPVSPPPRGNFKVKEKSVELELGETEEIPQVVQKSAKVSLVPKDDENKADSHELQTLYMDVKFADENQNYLELGEATNLEATYVMENADISLADMDAFGKVEVAVQQMKKLDLPKLEFHEEQEQITVADVNLSPVVISPKSKQLHAEYHVEETENYPDYSLSLQAVPRSLLKEAHEDTIQVRSDNVLEVPEIRYNDSKEVTVPETEAHVAEKTTVDTFKAPKIYRGEEQEEMSARGVEPLADVTNTTLKPSEIAILDLWKALVQESKTELHTLEAKETNINMIGLEVISDITPLSPDIAKEFDLPGESYLHVEQAKKETSVYVPPPELKNSQEAVLLLKEHEIIDVPHKKEEEGKAKVLAVPTQRLENVQSTKPEIMPAQNFAEEHIIDTRQEYIYIIPPSGGQDAQVSTLPRLDMDKARAQHYRMQQFPEEHTIDLKEEVILTIDDPSSPNTASSSMLPQQQMDRANAQRYRIQQLATEQVIDIKEQKVIVIEPPEPTTAGESSLPHLEMDRARAERYSIQQLAQEGVEDLEEQKVDTIHPHSSDAARESTLPHLELDRARAERYRTHQMAEEGSVDIIELKVDTIQPRTSDAARESTLPSLEMDRARAERYRTQQMAEEGSVDIIELKVDTIQHRTSDAARESTLPNVEMDRARAERYRIEQMAEEGSVDLKEMRVAWIDPHSRDEARRSTLPHTEMDQAHAERYRVQQLAEEGSVDIKEHAVGTIQPHDSDAARESTLPDLEMDRARAERYRIHQLAQEGSVDVKEQHVNWIDPHTSDAARRSTLPHLEMDRAQAERYRIQQLAQEGNVDVKEQNLGTIQPHTSDAARRSTLPHVEMGQARAERYRIHQLAQEGSVDAKEQHVNWIDPHTSDTARRSTLPHLEMDRAQAERYRIQQLAREGSYDVKEHSVGIIQPDTSDAARRSTLPHLEMDRAQAERYRIQQLAREGSYDVREHSVGIIHPDTSDAARRSTLPHLEMDRAQAERYRIQQLAREGSYDVREHSVGIIQPDTSDAARRSTLPHLEMDRAQAERYRIQQLAREGSYDVREHSVGTIYPTTSDAARRSTLPHLQLDQARAERYRIHQLGREEVVNTREAYVDRIPSSSSHPHHGRIIVVDGYPVHMMRPKPTTWIEIPAPMVRNPPRETVVNSSVRNVIGVIPPLATDAARQGSIPAEVLQKVQEQRVESHQAPTDERNVHERVEITSVIPPLPADIAHKAETPAEVFRRVHSHHVHSHHVHSGQETSLNDVVEPQKPLPPLETRTSMWRLVPGHESATARSSSKESHYMPETEVANGPIPPVERMVPSQQVVTSDEFHRADASTLHSSWVPAEIQVVGELDTLMQQGIIRFNPLSQIVENGADVHDYDEMFMVKQHSGIRRSSSLQYPVSTRPPQQANGFKVGHIPQVGYPTKQWTSAQQLASESVEDRGDDDFDYDKLIRMTTGGKHEVPYEQLPKSGWSTIEVTGQDNVAEVQQRSLERIYNRQDSVFIDYRRPKPKSDKPPFAFDFSRLIHWTIGEQNEIEKLPTHPGANPPHLVPINYDKTTTWVVGADPGSGTEKTYVSVAVPVRVRNTYFVEGSDARTDSRSDIVKSPEATVLHDMQDWKTLTRQGGRSVYSAMSDEPQYSSAPPLQAFQGYHQPYDGAYGDSRQYRRQGSTDSSTSGRVKRRAPQPPAQRTTSPVQHVYTSPPPSRPATSPVFQEPASAHAFHVQSLQNGYVTPSARPLSPPHGSRSPSIPPHPKGPAPQPPATLSPPPGTADTTVPKAAMVNGRQSPLELFNGNDYVDLRDSEVSSVSSYGSQKGAKVKRSSKGYFPIFRRSSSKESFGKRPSVLEDRSPTEQPKRRRSKIQI